MGISIKFIDYSVRVRLRTTKGMWFLLIHGCHRSANSQGKIKFFEVREFYFESGKIEILKKSQGKLKL